MARPPVNVGRFLEHLVGTEGKTLATARLRLAAIAAAHRLGGHKDPTSRPLVKATMKRLAREHGKLRKQAKGLTSEALAAVKATAQIRRVHQGKRRRKEASQTGQGAHIRDPGRGEGHRPHPARPPGQAPQEGDGR